MYHTLGQRKGLRIGGLSDAGEEPWYVVEKDLLRNVLIVGQGHNHPRLFSKGLIANQLHWVDRQALSAPIRGMDWARLGRSATSSKISITRGSSDNFEMVFASASIASKG